MKKSELPDTLDVLKDICTLIVEVRTATAENARGREEGVHCSAVLNSHLKHTCDTENIIQCQKLALLHESLPLLLERDITICVDTIGSHLAYNSESLQVSTGSEDLLLERWTITLHKSGSGKTGGTKLLLQAVHSHLHFSQLSAWLSSSHGHFPASVTYRITSQDRLEFKVAPDQHRFPIAVVGDNRSVVVVANSLPRSSLHIRDTHADPVKPMKLNFGETRPRNNSGELKPKTSPTTIKSPPTCSQQIKKKLCAEVATDCVPGTGGGDVCVLSTTDNFRRYDPLSLTDSGIDSGIFSPGSTFRSYPASPGRYSPASPQFFMGDESSLDSISADCYNAPTTFSTPLSISPTPYNSPQHNLIEASATTPLRSTPYPWPLSDMFTLSSPSRLTSPGRTTEPLFTFTPRVVASSPTPSTSSRPAEQLESLSFSPIKFDSPMKCLKGSQRRSSSLCIEEEEEDEFDSSMRPGTSVDDVRASWHGNPFLDKPSFKRSTSLPLLSSPIMYRKSCCRGDRKITGQKVVNFDKNCLLGTFEESILKDRFSPCGTIPGFKFKMSVSGLFSSPSVTLPFTGNFYSFSDLYCPSPYTGCIKLDQCGTHGYQVSKQGRIQATILDPENSVIRIFLIPYDVRDMPPRSQTFIRQRIQAVSENGWKSLQYHIHLRLMSGRSSRVYLHTEIRVLFVRGTSSIDSGGESEREGVTMATENCIPSNPRYSTISKTKRSS